MRAAVSLMDGLGLDGDRCIRVMPRHALFLTQCYNFNGDVDANVKCEQSIKAATVSRRSNRLICSFCTSVWLHFILLVLNSYRLDQPRFALRIVCIELSNVRC